MKKTILLIAAAFAANIVLAQTQEPAKNMKPKASPAKEHVMTAEEKQQHDMQAWMAYMTPGSMHQMMATWNGDWKEEVTFWMAPGAEPQKNSATCKNSMIMGGRYQEPKHNSVMNGMPFEGTGTLAYDNAKKVFMSTWIDNMGTGIMYLEGRYDEKTKTIHFSGNSIDPMTGKTMKVREDFKIIDDNNQSLVMYMTQNGKEFKSMEITFRR